MIRGTSTDAFTVIAIRRLLLSAMRSNNDSNWPVHSLMLSLHDLRDLRPQQSPSIVTFSTVFGSLSCQNISGNNSCECGWHFPILKKITTSLHILCTRNYSKEEVHLLVGPGKTPRD